MEVAASTVPEVVVEPNVAKPKRGFKKLLSAVTGGHHHQPQSKPLTDEEKAKFEQESELYF